MKPDSALPTLDQAQARAVMEQARYGEPVDTYTWDHVVDACIRALLNSGFDLVRSRDIAVLTEVSDDA